MIANIKKLRSKNLKELMNKHFYIKIRYFYTYYDFYYFWNIILWKKI